MACACCVLKAGRGVADVLAVTLVFFFGVFSVLVLTYVLLKMCAVLPGRVLCVCSALPLSDSEVALVGRAFAAPSTDRPEVQYQVMAGCDCGP
jgi:hypothetical protein